MVYKPTALMPVADFFTNIDSNQILFKALFLCNQCD